VGFSYFYFMRLFLILAFATTLSSCSNRMIETSLYFGQSRPDGSTVTEEEWNTFRNTYVLAVFKEGATAIPVSGNWFDPEQKQMITESTYIVVYTYKPSYSLSKKIDGLREEYKRQHKQQSVLRVDRKVKASF